MTGRRPGHPPRRRGQLRPLGMQEQAHHAGLRGHQVARPVRRDRHRDPLGTGPPAAPRRPPSWPPESQRQESTPGRPRPGRVPSPPLPQLLPQIPQLLPQIQRLAGLWRTGSQGDITQDAEHLTGIRPTAMLSLPAHRRSHAPAPRSSDAARRTRPPRCQNSPSSAPHACALLPGPDDQQHRGAAVVRVSPPADIRPRQVPSGPDRSPSRIEEMFPCRAARDDRFPAGGQVAQQPSVAHILTRASF
jgi:hypothetical protein